MSRDDEPIEGAMAELIPLDSPARSTPLSHVMTVERDRHLERIVDEAEALIVDKYRRGQAEHGFNLWEKPGMLEQAMQETADQFAYQVTLGEQMSGLALALRRGTITNEEAAAALERMIRA